MYVFTVRLAIGTLWLLNALCTLTNGPREEIFMSESSWRATGNWKPGCPCHIFGHPHLFTLPYVMCFSLSSHVFG